MKTIIFTKYGKIFLRIIKDRAKLDMTITGRRCLLDITMCAWFLANVTAINCFDDITYGSWNTDITLTNHHIVLPLFGHLVVYS